MHLRRITVTLAVFGALSVTAAHADTAPWFFPWLRPAPAPVVAPHAVVRSHAAVVHVRNIEPSHSLQSGSYLVLGLGF
jgi:hypothetical protein